MGLVVFEDPIEHISGKISKKFRTCYNFRRASKRKYTSVRGDRTTPVSADESKQRIKFRVVRLAALDRSMDLSKVSADQEVFLAERRLPCEYRVFFWVRPKSAIKERVSLAVTAAGFIMFMNLLFLVAMPTPPILLLNAVPCLDRSPTP